MSRELECPICNADVPLSGDEKTGEEVFCAFCRAPLRITAGKEDDELLLEDDF